MPVRRSAKWICNIRRPIRHTETLEGHKVAQVIDVAQFGLGQIKLHQPELHAIRLVLAIAGSSAGAYSAHLSQSLCRRSGTNRKQVHSRSRNVDTRLYGEALGKN